MLFSLWTSLTTEIFPEEVQLTYFQAKQLAETYNVRRQMLIGPQGPFVGWPTTGKTYEDFKLVI